MKYSNVGSEKLLVVKNFPIWEVWLAGKGRRKKEGGFHSVEGDIFYFKLNFIRIMISIIN